MTAPDVTFPPVQWIATSLTMTTNHPSLPLPLEVSVRLTEIFQANGWLRNKPPSEVALFKKYCAFLTALTPEERDLILDLSSRYLYCSLNDYDISTEELVDHLIHTSIDGIRSAVLLPLVKPSQSHRIKSSQTYAYIVKGKLLDHVDWHGRPILDFPTADHWLKASTPQPDQILLFCDDFIGSGDTALASLEPLKSIIDSSATQVAIIALAVHQRAAERLLQAHPKLHLLYYYSRRRGISDGCSLADRTSAASLMEQIEARLDISSDYHFGYKRTEGLESGMRTPNNTFPAFWARMGNNKSPWPHPFSR